jgi:CO/xanthine dehydrogenase FAD-binding subunit
VSASEVTIGAMTRHAEVANSAEVKKAIPRSPRWPA